MTNGRTPIKPTLDLALIGNCCISALIDARGRIVWSCFPRFDGDPVFHALLGSRTGEPDEGMFEIELLDAVSFSQRYVGNTAIVRTVIEGPSGAIEIIDFAPRFKWLQRSFRPQMLVRRIRPLRGSPRIRIKVKPRYDYGRTAPVVGYGSNHIRYIGTDTSLRLTTDAPIDYIVAETAFILDDPINLIFGPDETLTSGVSETARDFEERTTNYWREWVHRLALPLEWQDAVIRAAITLKLCSYEPTGAIVAAMTTSIPEAAGTVRTWDYRFCWIRDAFFVVRALNSLAAVRTMELYFRWMMNIVADARDGHIQPVYGIGLEKDLVEKEMSALPGYRDMGPVRSGNQAYRQFQHDTYGNLILGASQAFVDRRLFMEVGEVEFARLETVGERAFLLHDKPDAGLWELRTRERPHTSSAILCWAGCDRLAKIGHHLGLTDRAATWRGRADQIKATVLARSWSEERRAFVESFGGRTLDASVLLMGEVDMIDPKDPRFISTVDQLEKVLARGPFMMRYEEADDFGAPETAFNVCAFWRLDALARIGRKEQAREIFEGLLAARNPLGLMSEDTDPTTGEAWGNFPQTYSMVGIINGAMRLSKPWESTV
jgi:GH15 family glucan-1,4-alpha-glucosidase